MTPKTYDELLAEVITLRQTVENYECALKAMDNCNSKLREERCRLQFNTEELNKVWEEGFYDSEWEPGTLTLTPDEEKIVKDICSILPRHMHVYDWERPFAEMILLSLRRHAARSP